MNSWPTYEIGGVGGAAIRRFSDTHLQRSIDAAIADLPPDKHLAIVGFVDGHATVRFAAVARLGKNWSAVGVLEHTRDGAGWTGEAAVRWAV